MLLDSDDFELFGLPRRFALEPRELEARRRTLQAQVHPDRFAADGAAAQRVAMQWAVRVNEGYERLKDPLRRAGYLCELEGAPIAAEDNTAMAPEFLMQQMAWREALDQAAGRDEVEAIAAELDAHRRAAYASLAAALDGSADFRAAAQQVRALMFVERFADDVEQRLESLEA
jgi:molecular chaperone HscB